MKRARCTCLRSRVIEFLIRSSQLLEVSPIVKYSALSLFADRFYPALSRYMIHLLYLFKKFKSLGDKFIKEQHYTMGDILEAEIVLMQVVQFGIGMSKITFSSVEDLLVQFKAIAQVGEHVKFEACMDVMDLLYENEETSVLYSSPEALAASVVVVGYIITVPPQRWEFPVLPWVKFVTSCKEEDILDTVRVILKHIFEPQADYYVANE